MDVLEASQLLDRFDVDHLHILVQPQVHCSSGRIFGAELLSRWEYEPGVWMLASLLFSLLSKEQSFAVFRKVVHEACLCIALTGKCISVNVSASDLENPEFLSCLAQAVSEYSIDPGLLHLELTEQVLSCCSSSFYKTIFALSDAGFFLELDDFGTGFSALDILGRLPVRSIKLSKDMLSLLDTFRGVRILENIFEMARHMNIRVIAEGVEDTDQCLALQKMGCCFMQGYLFFPPVAVEQYLQLVRVSASV